MNVIKISMFGLLLLSQWAVAQTVPVRVTEVSYSNYAKAVIASGVVRPVSEQTLSFKVPGILKKILVREGQVVQKGQLLASLELEEMNAQVAKAEAMLSDAERKLARLIELENKKLASDEQIRQVMTQVKIAKSELRIASFNQKHAQIHAPANGRILSRKIESNELVQSGQPVLEFADEEQGWAVNLSVADVDVVMLNILDVAQVTLDAYPGKVFDAQIRDISGKANAMTQTFEVELNLEAEQRLYSGLIAHTKIIPSIQAYVARIPLGALLNAKGLDANVYVLNAHNEATLRGVKLAYFDNEFAYVKNGLKNQERLVIEGGSFIRDGKDIAVVNL